MAKRRLKADPALQQLLQGRDSLVQELPKYRFRPDEYIREVLGWAPWGGVDAQHPGQREVIEAYKLALWQQTERNAWEHGQLTENSCRHWQPGQLIRNWIKVDAGHTVGKTKLGSGLVNHFFDTWGPAIIYTFAPSWLQIHDLLWKEIKVDRRGKKLPGRILDLELKRADDWFAKGRATNDSGGSGTERIQGQHGANLLFLLDEAEGVADYVFDAVNSMASGGLVIVLMFANPRTQTSRFYQEGESPHVRSFNLSCIWHPNVLQGREVVPGAVRRDYVERMLEQHAERVEQHCEAEYTFEMPWRPGEIYRPDSEFLFRVLGIAPGNVSADTLVQVGVYDAACSREVQCPESELFRVRMGFDCSRWGTDFSTLYVNHRRRLWRAAQIAQQETLATVQRIKSEALALRRAMDDDLERLKSAQPRPSLHIRIDAGGGYGSGVIDMLYADHELREAYPEFQVLEVHFNSNAYDREAYDDLVTEMYAETGKVLAGLALGDVPKSLKVDLCDRRYRWATSSGGVAVKKLESKERFKDRNKRSPDDGDGAVLATAPDYVFETGAFIL